MSSPIPGIRSDRARNINVWKDAEVYTSTDLSAQVGADGTFDPEVWDMFGLLNTGSAIGQEMDIARNDVQSFGAVTQLQDVRFNKDSRAVTALEENATNFSLLWPGSEWEPDGVSVLMAPDTSAEVVVAFKTTNSFGDVLIDISRRPALAYAPGSSINDEGASTTDFTFDVLKDEDGGLYDRLRIRDDGTAVVADLTPIRGEGTGDPVVP